MIRTLALVATLLAASAARADDAPTHLAAYAYLLGTWSCAHQVGDFSGRYTTTWSKALGDRWLRQTYDFEGAPGKPNWQAEALMTWVPSRKQWVRFLALSLGEHFPMRLTEREGGWSWTYVGLFATKPAAPRPPDASLTRKSDTEYIIEGPSYPEGGKTVTEHHQCRKM